MAEAIEEIEEPWAAAVPGEGSESDALSTSHMPH